MTIDPQNASSAGLIDRIKNIILTPQAEWDRIAPEPADVQKIYIGYVLPLALFSALCSFIGMSVFGVLGWRIPLMPGLIGVAVQVALSLCSVFVLAFVANALASSFGSRQDMGQAHKLAAYGSTAFYLAGVFSLFPPLGILALVGLYSFALIYIGLPRVMGTPEDKRVIYLISIIVVAIIVQLILGTIVGSIMAMVPGYAPPNPFGV